MTSGSYWIGAPEPKLCASTSASQCSSDFDSDFCRILRSQMVVVRVGGGWQTLTRFLYAHFPHVSRSSRAGSLLTRRSCLRPRHRNPNRHCSALAAASPSGSGPRRSSTAQQARPSVSVGPALTARFSTRPFDARASSEAPAHSRPLRARPRSSPTGRIYRASSAPRRSARPAAARPATRPSSRLVRPGASPSPSAAPICRFALSIVVSSLRLYTVSVERGRLHVLLGHDERHQARPARERPRSSALARQTVILLPRKARPLVLAQDVGHDVGPQLGVDGRRALLVWAGLGRVDLDEARQLLACRAADRFAPVRRGRTPDQQEEAAQTGFGRTRICVRAYARTAEGACKFGLILRTL